MSTCAFALVRSPWTLAALAALHAPAAMAQSGSFVAGSFLGIAYAAGDVDDDGFGDFVVRLSQGYEVRSGATGLPFLHLSRSAPGCVTCAYAGLFGDLDVDGCDDLVFTDGSGSAEFVSGANGAALLQLSGSGISPVLQAVDHDGDGHDDLMIAMSVPTGGGSGTLVQQVISGRTQSVIAAFQTSYSATSGGMVQWCGDVDGDGHVDLLRTTTSLGNPFTQVLLGPQHTLALTTYSGTPVQPAADTNGDGRDELIVGADLVDPGTGVVVWAMSPLFPTASWFLADVDGDGASDALASTAAQVGVVYSGRTQTAWPGTLPLPLVVLGDRDGDGRDEFAAAWTQYSLQGAPAASFVRDRGVPGTTSLASRPRIRHRLVPRLGETMLVDLVGAGGPQPAFLVLGGALDVDLAPLGAPGNRAYVDLLASTPRLADASGRVRFSLAVPNGPALVGLPFSLQWAVLDPAANALGLATSNALDCRIGN